jgi:hypothetical protein
MDRALPVHGPAILATMLDRSLLVDAGPDLRESHLRLATGQLVSPSAHDVLALEIGLQSMRGQVAR